MRYENAKVRLGQLAERQWGRVTSAQIAGLEIKRPMISRWVKQGYLHRVHPRVYAVGHRAPSTEADLAAALLYAGPGAMLSHATAAWWLGLVDKQPATIHVTTPRRRRSLPKVRVHDRRAGDRIWHRLMPTTTIARTLVDYAGPAKLAGLRRALAEADYRGLLDLQVIETEAGRGRPGSAKLRRALEEHQPRLAMTRSRLERAFLELCESAGLPLPEINARVEGWTVDALWREQRLVVELDGYGNHHTRAQIERDRRKELKLRAAGYTVVRYTERQVTEDGDVVVADLWASGSLSPPVRSA